MSDTSHIYSKEAARYVSIASAWFVTLLVLYLFVSAVLQHLHFAEYGASNLIAGCATPECQRLALESDIQNMRSARVGYALIYRFSLSAAAIVVSLATIILGSVLVFDRVRSPAENAAEIQASELKLMANSTFPGLIMVFLGSCTLSITLLFTNSLSPVVEVRDVPVFVQDLNTWRNTVGMTAGVKISPAEQADATDEAEAQQDAARTGRELKDFKLLLDEQTEPQNGGTSNDPS
ncbi:hypothetical protein WNZ14_23500 [Hoeflea sp. AS60]|uniref:hypothetical protein n=1 Tax=Hoeflea sp. AS60 TaxID=3135780 RepID=UPI00317A4848